MSDKGMASIQFSNTQPVQPDFSGGHRMGVEIGREKEQEAPIALSAQNLTSADAATAWRVRRNGPPLPYSKRTSGSLYRFDKE
jgi:hypothetical protein